jgi:uncharacterized membrane protein YphA (DoxX/SURF4 family)
LPVSVATILSVLLALAFIAAGVPKIIAIPAMVQAAEHVGFSMNAYRVIGVLEVAGAAGLFLGIVVPALGVAATAGLAALMAGAAITHLRIGDNVSMALPAAGLALLAIVTLVLWV